MHRSILRTCCLFLLCTACAQKAPGYSMDPEAYRDDAMGVDAAGGAYMEEMAYAAPAYEAPASAPASAGMGTAGPVFAAPQPVAEGARINGSGQAEASEGSLDELQTMGADSVDQMLIFTGQLALRVEFGKTAQTIDAAVGLAVNAGGYVAEMTDSSLRLRVPSKRFRKVMTQIEGLGEVQSRGVSALDVSEEFHDLGVQLENLKATRERIEKLLSQAKDLTQILTIEQELQRVTSEIDRIEGRMRLLSSQAAFSTINLGVGERPQQQDVKIAADDAPPTPPRTLSNSAPWISEVGVHGLMNFSN